MTHSGHAQGCYVHSESERVLRSAVLRLSPDYRIELHHQVPLSFVLGFRHELEPTEQKLLKSEIDAVITQHYSVDPDGHVVLPIKLDMHDSHRNDEVRAEKDKSIRNLCQRFGVPLLTVRPKNSGYELDCPMLDTPSRTSDKRDSKSWADALAPFLGAAINYAGLNF